MSALAELPDRPRTLAECEEVIKRGLQTFIEVGEALLEVRDRRLYRERFATFEEYCRGRWGFVASRARQLIAAAGVAQTVTDVTLPPPSSEAVARELAPLRGEPERLHAVWTTAVERYGPSPTAAQVREVVRGLPEPAAPRRRRESPVRLIIHFDSEEDRERFCEQVCEGCGAPIWAPEEVDRRSDLVWKAWWPPREQRERLERATDAAVPELLDAVFDLEDGVSNLGAFARRVQRLHGDFLGP